MQTSAILSIITLFKQISVACATLIALLANLTGLVVTFAQSVAVQTGCSHSSQTAQSIHLREKNIASPTENASRVGKPFLLASGVTAFISRFTLDVGRAPKCLHFVLARIRHLGLPPTQKALAFLARREGLAFFDEDGVCAGFWCVHSLSELLPQSVTLFFRGRTPINTLAG